MYANMAHYLGMEKYNVGNLCIYANFHGKQTHPIIVIVGGTPKSLSLRSATNQF